ncbi:MAG: succinate dehydrogenase, cytochrome b556 subunit [Gammaproteobacteria bacterium]
MATDNRPLSPHLQIYKPQLTSVLSITHRGTGVFLTVGAFFLTFWLLALADGPERFAQLQAYLTSWYGQCLFYAFVFSLYFHLCNGIRHLFWDVGLGLDIDVVYKTGYAVVAVSVIFTLLTLCLAARGAA